MFISSTTWAVPKAYRNICMVLASFRMSVFTLAFRLIALRSRICNAPQENFESILRRSLVIVHRARFVTADRLAELFPDGGGRRRGTSRRIRPSRSSSSPRAGRVLFSMILSFASKHSVEDCRALLDSCVEGGDGGITRAVMRRACGLSAEVSIPPPATPHAQSATPVVGCQPPSQGPPGQTVEVPPQIAAAEQHAVAPVFVADSQDVRPAESVANRLVPRFLLSFDEAVHRRHVQLVMYCLTTSRDYMTASHLPRLPADVWPGVSTKEKQATWADLARRGLWRLVGPRGKALEPFIPMIRTRRSLKDVLPVPPVSLSLTTGLQETVASAKLTAAAGDDVTAANDGCILGFLDEEVCSSALPKRGVRSAGVRLASENAMSNAEKYRSHVRSLADLALEVQGYERSMAVVVAGSQDETARLRRVYAHKNGSWGRRYVEKGGMQSCSRRVRMQVLPPDVVDLDLANAMVSLVTEVLGRMELCDAWPAEVLSSWRAYGADTERLRGDIQGLLGVPAKSLLLRIAHGGSVPRVADDGLQRWLEQLSHDAHFLRWLAVSHLPELFEEFSSSNRHWPENTTFVYFWQTMEDRALAWLEWFVTAEGSSLQRHCSLHFDGRMLSGDRFQPGTTFREDAENFIREKLSISIHLVYKTHRSFWEWVQHLGQEEQGDLDTPASHLSLQQDRRRCIPYHLALITGLWTPIMPSWTARMPRGVVCSRRSPRWGTAAPRGSLWLGLARRAVPHSSSRGRIPLPSDGGCNAGSPGQLPLHLVGQKLRAIQE